MTKSTIELDGFGQKGKFTLCLSPVNRGDRERESTRMTVKGVKEPPVLDPGNPDKFAKLEDSDFSYTWWDGSVVQRIKKKFDERRGVVFDGVTYQPCRGGKNQMFFGQLARWISLHSPYTDGNFKRKLVNRVEKLMGEYRVSDRLPHKQYKIPIEIKVFLLMVDVWLIRILRKEKHSGDKKVRLHRNFVRLALLDMFLNEHQVQPVEEQVNVRVNIETTGNLFGDSEDDESEPQVKETVEEKEDVMSMIWQKDASVGFQFGDVKQEHRGSPGYSATVPNCLYQQLRFDSESPKKLDFSEYRNGAFRAGLCALSAMGAGNCAGVIAKSLEWVERDPPPKVPDPKSASKEYVRITVEQSEENRLAVERIVGKLGLFYHKETKRDSILTAAYCVGMCFIGNLKDFVPLILGWDDTQHKEESQQSLMEQASADNSDVVNEVEEKNNSSFTVSTPGEIDCCDTPWVFPGADRMNVRVSE